MKKILKFVALFALIWCVIYVYIYYKPKFEIPTTCVACKYLQILPILFVIVFKKIYPALVKICCPISKSNIKILQTHIANLHLCVSPILIIQGACIHFVSNQCFCISSCCFTFFSKPPISHSHVFLTGGGLTGSLCSSTHMHAPQWLTLLPQM